MKRRGIVSSPGAREEGDSQFSRSVVSDFAAPWTAARQASLSITNSQSLLKLMSIESVRPSNHLILCCPLLLPPSVFPSIRARFQEYVNQELPDVQAGFRKGTGTRDQIANICWTIEKAREFRRTSISASLTNGGDLVGPWVGKIPWRRERLLTPVFWPREFHGLYSPWGRKELDTTEQFSFFISLLLRKKIAPYKIIFSQYM